MSIYKANDIRGIYGSELRDSDAYKLGNAFVRFTKTERVIVGRDNRLSSPALHEALTEGILDAGADVLDIGMIDSPGFYFATVYLECPGLMITASHNPPEYNGCYLANAQAVPINESNGLKTIEKLSENVQKARHLGKIFNVPINRPYRKHVFSFVQPLTLKPLKVVVDAGNGVGANIAFSIFSKLPLTFIPLYFESDGRYPHHGLDPSKPENLKQLAQKVVQVGADLGIAFDGDADRAGFVDEQGQIIECSIVGALLATHLLKEHPGKPIVYSSTCSKILPETIQRQKGKPVREKVGHTFIKLRMHQLNALLGIENTGHFMFQKNFYVDSGIIAGLTMCQIASQTDKRLSEFVKPYKKYYKSSEINFQTVNTAGIVKGLIPEIKKYKPTSLDLYDGITADFENYWISIRASKTEPFVRLIVEGINKQLVEQQVRTFSQIIKSKLTS